MPLRHSEVTCKLVECGVLLEAEHLVCVSMEGLSFKGAFDQRPSETLAHSHWLGVVEVASATWSIFHYGKNSITFFGVRNPVLRKSEVASVKEPSQDYEGAHFKLTGESFQVFRRVVSIHLDISECLCWNEKLCSNFITPPLDHVRR